MSTPADTSKRLFFSIKEVAKMFHLRESTLRFWEKEFSQLKPKKNASGVRFYKQEDIETVRLIHYLVKERKLTLEGARQKLKTNIEQTVQTEDIVNRLKEIKSELLSLRDALNDIDDETNI